MEQSANDIKLLMHGKLDAQNFSMKKGQAYDIKFKDVVVSNDEVDGVVAAIMELP